MMSKAYEDGVAMSPKGKFRSYSREAMDDIINATASPFLGFANDSTPMTALTTVEQHQPHHRLVSENESLRQQLFQERERSKDFSIQLAIKTEEVASLVHEIGVLREQYTQLEKYQAKELVHSNHVTTDTLQLLSHRSQEFQLMSEENSKLLFNVTQFSNDKTNELHTANHRVSELMDLLSRKVRIIHTIQTMHTMHTIHYTFGKFSQSRYKRR